MRLIGVMLLVMVATGFSVRGQEVEPVDQGEVEAHHHGNAFSSSAKYLPDKTVRGGKAEIGFVLETMSGAGLPEDRLNRTAFAIILKLDEFGVFASRNVVDLGKAKFKRGRKESTEFRHIYEDSPGTYRVVYVLSSERDMSRWNGLSSQGRLRHGASDLRRSGPLWRRIHDPPACLQAVRIDTALEPADHDPILPNRTIAMNDIEPNLTNFQSSNPQTPDQEPSFASRKKEVKKILADSRQGERRGWPGPLRLRGRGPERAGRAGREGLAGGRGETGDRGSGGPGRRGRR